MELAIDKASERKWERIGRRYRSPGRSSDVRRWDAMQRPTTMTRSNQLQDQPKDTMPYEWVSSAALMENQQRPEIPDGRRETRYFSWSTYTYIYTYTCDLKPIPTTETMIVWLWVPSITFNIGILIYWCVAVCTAGTTTWSKFEEEVRCASNRVSRH